MSVWIAGYQEFISNSCIVERETENKTLTKLNINADRLKSCKISWSQLSFLYKCGKLTTSTIQKEEKLRIKECTYLDEELVLLTDCNKVCHEEMVDDEEEGGRKFKNQNDNTFSSIDSTDKMLILQKLDDTSSIVRVHVDVTQKKDGGKTQYTYGIPQSVSIGKAVTQVSCGKEHILVATEMGQVYSFGGGSRGQLGHGNVQNLENPKMVEGLVGVTMVTVAAGGWHSTVISALGDLYIWGWNESGQLGHPCKSCQKVTAKTGISVNKNLNSSSSSSSSSLSSNILDVNRGQGHSIVKSPTIKPDTVVSSEMEEGVEPDPLESLLFIQDTGAVQVQSEPCIVDLGDDIKVKKVACGSRHTVILAENCVVLSAGWNDYGQLCQGDTDSRDFFETVNFFRKIKLKVTDIYAGGWSTIFIVDDQHGHDV